MELSQPIYRILNHTELEALEKQFVFFLSSQGIDANDWVKIKQHDQQKALEFIIQFSNFIFEDILDRLDYLIRSKSKSIEVFHCQANQLVCLEVTSNRSELDLTTLNLFEPSSYNDTNQLSILTKQKKYSSRGRKFDLFQLMENGCGITDGQLYRALCMMM